MKKILLLITFPFILFSQVSLEITYEQVTEGPKYLQGKYGKINPVVVIQKEGTAAELYSETIAWINETYKSADDVIKGKNENKYIKINGFTENLTRMNVLGYFYYDARYTIEFRFKDNRFQVSIISLESYNEPNQYTLGGWSDQPLTFVVENRKGKINKDNDYNLTSIKNYFENLLNNLYNYNSSTVDNDEYDF